jgi:hypothetical protein
VNSAHTHTLTLTIHPRDKMLPLPQFRTRRILIILCVVLSVALVIHLVTKAVAFAQLFGVFRPHAGIRITQAQVADAYSNSANTHGKTPVIPKILHQIFHNWKDPGNATLPDHWTAARQSCIDNNPDWEVKVCRAARESLSPRPPRLPPADPMISNGTWRTRAPF